MSYKYFEKICLTIYLNIKCSIGNAAFINFLTFIWGIIEIHTNFSISLHLWNNIIQKENILLET